MSNFSDREDRDLVRIVKACVDRGEKMSWIAVARKMAYSKKTNEQLRGRFKTLTVTYGKRLDDFPRCFFQPIQQDKRKTKTARQVCDHSKPPQRVTTSLQPIASVSAQDAGIKSHNMNTSQRPIITSTPTQIIQGPTADHTNERSQGNVTSDLGNGNLLLEFNAILHNAAPEVCLKSQCGAIDWDSFLAPTKSSTRKLNRRYRPPAVRVASSTAFIPAQPLAENESHEATAGIFASISPTAVRQKAGHTAGNVGELSVMGVTELARVCSLSRNDVFLDVGSGIGNVIVQLALETTVREAVGVEMRVDVAELGKSHIRTAQSTYPQLSKVRVIVDDIRRLQLDGDARASTATVLFSHNTVFEADSLLALQRTCCNMLALRLVVVSVQVCPRHRNSCNEDFCQKWKLVQEVPLGVSYNKSLAKMYMYERGELNKAIDAL